MPSYALYKKILGSKTNGQVHKDESDKIMNATWWNDINSRVAYLYDYYHDDHITVLDDLDPENDPKKIPIDIKFLKHTSQTYDKDNVSVHLQLRPGQKCNVDYYDEYFGKRYGAYFPIGLYCDIQDESGQYNRWLIANKANADNATQFPTYELLRCDYIFQYVIDNTKYQIAGVLRSQNSYNSGIWTDNKVTSIEDQQKFAVPLNRDTEKIFYNLRMIIDNKVLTEPRCWQVTKVNRISPSGVARITLAQNYFDQNKDYIESDSNGNVVGMWADYYKSSVTPSDFNTTTPTSKHSVISYAGLKSEIKIGGSYKKFTVDFFDGDNPDIFDPTGTWQFTIDGVVAPVSTSTSGLNSNQIKVKFDGNSSYIGKTMIISYITASITSSLEVAIVSL